MTKIVIIDYGVGNFRNVQKAFQVVGASAEITESIPMVSNADAVVLPGVGAFGDAIHNLRQRGLDEPVLQAVRDGKPVLGICVGLQLLFDKSEEMGSHTGLENLCWEYVLVYSCCLIRVRKWGVTQGSVFYPAESCVSQKANYLCLTWAGIKSILYGSTPYSTTF